MRKAKNTENSVPEEEQFEDFNQDDFADLDDLTENEEGSEQTLSPEESDFDTEYHGADPDLPADIQEGPVSQAKRSIIDLLKDNWLYVGIGIVVLVVAIYLIMSLFPSSPAPQAAASAQQQAPSAGFNNVPNQGAQEQQNAAGGTSAPTVNAAPSNITMTQAQMQALIQGFTDSVQQNTANLQQALNNAGGSDQKLEAMANEVNGLNATMTKLNQSLANTTHQLTETQSQLNTLLASQTATSQNLTLRAVVPGRAWLVDGQGHTTSVTVGTPLGSLGTVTVIDPTANSVTMSSGYVFK